MTEATYATPWYRQRWPWLLMIMPATAIVGGIFTWWLAANANNSMVVDDYYKEGRAINQQLARDDRAAQLGLAATLAAGSPGDRSGAGGIAVDLRGRLDAAALPDSLTLRLVHATESSLDAQLTLRHAGGGRYLGAGVLPGSGHWIVHLEDPQRSWRLLARTDRFDVPLELASDPVLAGGRR
ncbi:FixH family protein [Burkholderiaceae bacterium FT117]|uniref:FixH family protein n=1 Tax=Zeimonas sediminis TaxID=2944268 RepID=UPI002342D499|nr:FixH family protein [Zeimonas sediminis]MCM5570858.1 FixH family protein [Zeimonas sediminis]